jgi:hypothetical protein
MAAGGSTISEAWSADAGHAFGNPAAMPPQSTGM